MQKRIIHFILKWWVQSIYHDYVNTWIPQSGKNTRLYFSEGGPQRNQTIAKNISFCVWDVWTFLFRGQLWAIFSQNLKFINDCSCSWRFLWSFWTYNLHILLRIFCTLRKNYLLLLFQKRPVWGYKYVWPVFFQQFFRAMWSLIWTFERFSANSEA